MGRKTLLITTSVALIALGSWWFGRRGGPSSLDPARTGSAAAEQPTEGVSLPALTGDGRRDLVAEDSARTSWVVLAREANGQPADDATIETVLGEEALAGRGTATWEDVTPGVWRLVVTASDGQVIQRDVTVIAGRENKTYVRLGMPASVSGIVRNSRGERLRDHLVCFLRPGEELPEKAGRLRTLVATATDRDGAYELELPETGRWRPVVVRRGRALFEGSFETVQPDGRPRRCNIVVPARPRLVVTVEGSEEVLQSGEVLAVSLYRESTIAEAERDAEMRRRMERTIEARDDVDSPDFQEESASAVAFDEDPQRLIDLERQKRWRKVIPEGWRNAGTSMMPESGTLVFDFLDHDREYRIALRRGGEVFGVTQSIYLSFGEILSAHLAPPAPVDLDSIKVLRMAPMTLTPVNLGGRSPLPLGATWSS